MKKNTIYDHYIITRKRPLIIDIGGHPFKIIWKKNMVCLDRMKEVN